MAGIWASAASRSDACFSTNFDSRRSMTSQRAPSALGAWVQCVVTMLFREYARLVNCGGGADGWRVALGGALLAVSCQKRPHWPSRGLAKAKMNMCKSVYSQETA